VTATLAELYVKQGLIGRARDIYRRLAEEGDQAEEGITLLNGLLGRVQSRRGNH